MSDNPKDSTVDPSLLGTFVPLSGLRPEYLAELARGTTLVSLDAGHELIGDDRAPGLAWYLVAGELALRARDEDEGVMTAGTEDARFAVPGAAQGYASVRTLTAVRLVGVDRPRVSTLLILAEGRQAPHGAIPTDGWAVRLLRSDLFARVPPANVQRIFELMEPLSFDAGDSVVEQGSTGERYYVIRDGTYEVKYSPDPELPPVRVAVLGPGDTFGEEALVSGAARNATVRAISAGAVMSVTKDQFAELIQEPALDAVDRVRAEDLVRTGARWLDIRLPEEHAKNGIESSINIPLAEIRERASGLDTETAYVVYCNSGRRSAAGAFLLTQLGHHASVLAGGLTDAPVTAGGSSLGASSRDLQAELLAASQELEEALRQKVNVEATRRVEPAPDSGASEEAQHALLARQRALEEESLRATEALAQARRRKLELEEGVRSAEAAAVSLRSRAQEQIEALRAKAEARLQAEEVRLQSEYTQAADEMQRIEQARAEAEERFEAERARLEAELAEARERMEREAARIREEMEAARSGAAARTDEIQQQQASAETRLREETESRLRDERRRLESEFASSVEAQEKAKQDLAKAESAITAAQSEAEELSRRMRVEREAREAAERERERVEREALAADRAKAAAELEAAERERREAEARLQSALEQTLSRAPSKVASVEAMVAEANEAVASAQAAKADADEASERAEARIAVQRELEEELRLQLIEEAEAWLLDERERTESELQTALEETERLETLTERKAATKQRDRDHDMSLFADVSAQLGEEEDGGLDVIERSLRQREFAAEKASLAKRAQEDATAERMRAEQALEEARRRFSAPED